MPNHSSETMVRGRLQNAGADLAGPFHVTNSEGKVTKKCVVLLTCLVALTTNLEPVNSQRSSDFVNCFSRSSARRDHPKAMLSDSNLWSQKRF